MFTSFRLASEVSHLEKKSLVLVMVVVHSLSPQTASMNSTYRIMSLKEVDLLWMTWRDPC